MQVARRILMGTYALSAGYYDAYYKRAQQAGPRSAAKPSARPAGPRTAGMVHGARAAGGPQESACVSRNVEPCSQPFQ